MLFSVTQLRQFVFTDRPVADHSNLKRPPPHSPENRNSGSTRLSPQTKVVSLFVPASTKLLGDALDRIVCCVDGSLLTQSICVAAILAGKAAHSKTDCISTIMVQQDQITLALNVDGDGQPLDFGKERLIKHLLYPVSFNQRFVSTPTVHLGVTCIRSAGQDATDWKPNLAFEVQAENVRPEGFDLRVSVEWFNTASRITVGWLALVL